jgi:glycosyltransferase 2 family protein
LSGHAKNRLFLVAKILVSVGLIAWLFATTERSELLDAFTQANPLVMAGSVVLLLILALVQTARWRIVARSLGLLFPFGPALFIVLIGTFFNQVLPSSIGGDAVRVWRLNRSGVSLSKSLNSVVLDRLVALLGVAVITAGATTLLFRWVAEPGRRLALILVEVAIFAVLACVMFLDRLRLPSFLELNRGIRFTLARDSRRLFLAPRFILPALALSLAIHFGVSFVVWLLAGTVGADVALYECLFLVPAVILLAMLPVSVAGWGVREGAMIVALGAVGVSRSDALATSVLFGFATAASGIPGLFLWLATTRHWHTRTGEAPV